MLLNNKIAIITGASSGIGRATAKLLAQEGAKVAIADLDTQNGQTVVAEIQANGGTASFHQVDAAQESQIQAWIDAVVAQWGGIDILVANAGILFTRTVETATNDDWDKILGVNLKGYAFCAKYAVPSMRKRGGGAIVNIASISSFVAQPEFFLYNATKGAVLQLTRCLALDLAVDNIRVNCVCPGPIDTPMVDQFIKDHGLNPEEFHQQMSQSTILRRMGKPQEVAEAIVFLVSDKASYITATPLMVDGGYVAI